MEQSTQRGVRYITHNRFKGLAACGEQLNLPYGTELETVGDFLVTAEGKAVCFDTSENAKRHFARNDDGRGLERGALTWAIAFQERVRFGENGRKQRFTDEEIGTLERRWSRFLREDTETILFNEDFFAAEPEELRRIADEVHIKVKKRR